MEQEHRASFFHSRLGRVLLFVAIVWAIAGSFVAIEIGAQVAMAYMMADPARFSRVTLANATRDSKTCLPGPDTRIVSDGVGAADARVAAWLLGLNFGHEALARQYSSVKPETLAQVRREVESFASTLRVPPPTAFTPRHVAEANSEFIALIESDDNATARSLALSHSGEACHLFKLGALWGYATLVRPSLPDKAVFAAEIRHHAQDVLPATLWQPMTERAGSSADDVLRGDSALTEKLTRHLGSPRPR